MTRIGLLIKKMQEVAQGWYQTIRPFLTKQNIDSSILLLSIFIGAHFEWRIEQIIFFALIVWLILNPLSSAKLARFTIISFLLVPILLVDGKKSSAEEIALYAYYFLVITVVRAIFELFSRDSENKKTEKAVSV